MKDEIKRPDVFKDAKDSIDGLLATLNSFKNHLEEEQRKADRTAMIIGLFAALLGGFIIGKYTP